MDIFQFTSTPTLPAPSDVRYSPYSLRHLSQTWEYNMHYLRTSRSVPLPLSSLSAAAPACLPTRTIMQTEISCRALPTPSGEMVENYVCAYQH